MPPGRPASPRILFVLNDVAKFFSHREGLAEGLRSHGHRIDVAVPADDDAGRIEEAGFAVHPIPLRRQGLSPAHLVRAVLALARLYRRLRPDLVHHFTPKPVIYGGIAARLAGVPAVVHSIAGLDYPFAVRSPLALFLRGLATLGYRLALAGPGTQLIFENRDDLREFTRRGLRTEGRSHVIVGAGVDTETFSPAPEPGGTPRVLLAARMLEQKGVEEFAAAARRLARSGVEARMLLAGGTDPANPTSLPASRLEAWESEGLVEWLGEVPHREMPGLLRRSHVVCLPSYREGAPKVLLEAAASGRPIVASDVPGCRAVVEHAEDGLLVSPRDPAALAGALARLIGDPELRRRLGRRGRRRAEEEFSVGAVVRATEEVYRAAKSAGEGSRPGGPEEARAAAPPDGGRRP